MKKINIRDLKKSPVELISDNWALLTAGKEGDYNTMTVSWGAVGEIWGKDAAFIFIRPQRYTYEFTEKEDIPVRIYCVGTGWPMDWIMEKEDKIVNAVLKDNIPKNIESMF